MIAGHDSMKTDDEYRCTSDQYARRCLLDRSGMGMGTTCWTSSTLGAKKTVTRLSPPSLRPPALSLIKRTDTSVFPEPVHRNQNSGKHKSLQRHCMSRQVQANGYAQRLVA